jgi:DNA-binding CsgD family transcriptional regulator
MTNVESQSKSGVGPCKKSFCADRDNYPRPVIVQEGGILLEANQAARTHLDLWPAEMTGKSVLDHLFPMQCPERDAVEEKWSSTFQGRYPAVFMGQNHRPVLAVLESCTHSRDGNPIQVIAFQQMFPLEPDWAEATLPGSDPAGHMAALQQKDGTIRELIAQIEHERERTLADVRSNIERIALPLLRLIQEHVDEKDKHHLRLLSDCLDDIASPVVRSLEDLSRDLAPREIEICNMIRNGFSTKEIATLLRTSVQTVFSQRKSIRKKLGVTGKNANLISFLKALEANHRPRR